VAFTVYFYQTNVSNGHHHPLYDHHI
jgi:hypothetical protein